jgi:hypothetical protein
MSPLDCASLQAHICTHMQFCLYTTCLAHAYYHLHVTGHQSPCPGVVRASCASSHSTSFIQSTPGSSMPSWKGEPRLKFELCCQVPRHLLPTWSLGFMVSKRQTHTCFVGQLGWLQRKRIWHSRLRTSERATSHQSFIHSPAGVTANQPLPTSSWSSAG